MAKNKNKKKVEQPPLEQDTVPVVVSATPYDTVFIAQPKLKKIYLDADGIYYRDAFNINGQLVCGGSKKLIVKIIDRPTHL